jgi:hypothetical protein
MASLIAWADCTTYSLGCDDLSPVDVELTVGQHVKRTGHNWNTPKFDDIFVLEHNRERLLYAIPF